MPVPTTVSSITAQVIDTMTETCFGAAYAAPFARNGGTPGGGSAFLKATAP